MNLADNDVYQKLLKALEAGNYNAKPSQLRQGSMSLFFQNEDGTWRGGTEEEYKIAWAKHDAEDKVK